MTVTQSLGAPLVSVVICTRNRPDKIGTAVVSVLGNDHPAFDLTVIDQSTSDATEAILRPMCEADGRLHYIHVEKAGLSRAYNTGVLRTSGQLIAFTDDDCIVPSDWLTTIERAFESDSEADLLYGQVAAVQTNSGKGGSTPTLELTRSERLSRRDGFRVIGMGANFAARRRLFDVIGGFDEALGGGGPLRSSQDYDLAYRAYRAGSVILLRPEVKLLHDGHRDDEDWTAVLRNYGIGDGAFYSKHVRCGDPYALLLLFRHLAWHGARIVAKTALRHPPAQHLYLAGFFKGLVDGFKYKVDRRKRSYVLP